jgi:tetratricopeptide (TPR) repeat protein
VSNATVRYLAAARIAARNQVLTPDDGDTGSGAELRVLGTVDTIESRTVIHGQIIDRESGIVLWSGDYERPTDATAGLDEQFGATVGATIACVNFIRKKERTSLSLEVLALLVQACELVVTGRSDSRDATQRLARAAPELSRAEALVALSHLLRANSRVSKEEAAAMIAIAEAAIERALKSHRDNEMALAARAWLAASRGDNLQRERDLERSLAVDPDFPPARMGYFVLLRETGRLSEAQSVALRLLDSDDPREIGAMPLVAFNSAMLGDRASVEAAIVRGSVFSPPQAEGVRSTINLWWDETVRSSTVRDLANRAPGRRSAECWEAYFLALEAAQGRGVRGLPATCRSLPVDWRIRMLSRQGDADGAYALLEAEPIAEPRPTAFLFYPEMKAFRADPRFMPLAKAWGLVDYWVESGSWPDFCRERDAPYDCEAVAAAL